MKPEGTRLLRRGDVAELLTLDECIAAVGADSPKSRSWAVAHGPL